MRNNITDIFRIETLNSVYEIKVIEKDGEVASVCKKMGDGNKTYQVKVMGTDYLEKLVIGASFDVPGVVETSTVQDYTHYVPATEEKHRVEHANIQSFFAGLTDHLVGQVRGGAVMVEPETKVCGIDGCTVTVVPGLPRHEGSRMCKSGSIASGGSRAHCACDACY